MGCGKEAGKEYQRLIHRRHAKGARAQARQDHRDGHEHHIKTSLEARQTHTNPGLRRARGGVCLSSGLVPGARARPPSMLPLRARGPVPCYVSQGSLPPVGVEAHNSIAEATEMGSRPVRSWGRARAAGPPGEAGDRTRPTVGLC